MCLRFLKTADLGEKEPWCLVKAAKALRDWVDAGLILERGFESKSLLVAVVPQSSIHYRPTEPFA